MHFDINFVNNFAVGRATTTTTSVVEPVFVDASSLQQNGGSLPRTREFIRRRQTATSTNTSSTVTMASASTQNIHHTVTRSSITTETSSQIELRRNVVQEDHNYGEPGPSTIRHSRRINRQILSRHQRNPDELDKPLVQNEIPVDPLRIPENISGCLRNRTSRNNINMNNEQDSESDDDRPLLSLTGLSPIRANRSSARSSLRHSDESHISSQPGPSNIGSTTSSRTRTQKRPYYNEDSEEEDTSNRTKRRATPSSQQGRFVFNSKFSHLILCSFH